MIQGGNECFEGVRTGGNCIWGGREKTTTNFPEGVPSFSNRGGKITFFGLVVVKERDGKAKTEKKERVERPGDSPIKAKKMWSGIAGFDWREKQLTRGMMMGLGRRTKNHSTLCHITPGKPIYYNDEIREMLERGWVRRRKKKGNMNATQKRAKIKSCG